LNGSSSFSQEVENKEGNFLTIGVETGFPKVSENLSSIQARPRGVFGEQGSRKNSKGE
jgi:hypothetical protein